MFQSDRIIDIKTSVLHVNGEPKMITLDYIVDGTDEEKVQSGCTEKDLRLTTHYQMLQLQSSFNLCDCCFSNIGSTLYLANSVYHITHIVCNILINFWRVYLEKTQNMLSGVTSNQRERLKRQLISST